MNRPGQTGRHSRLPAPLRRIPGPLAGLLAIVAVLGISWALLVPPWQAPDEVAHFAYAQSLATRFALPGNKARSGESTDQATADGVVGASNLAFDPNAIRPNWNPDDYHAYLRNFRLADPSQSNGGGPNAQFVNPPLFYLYSDVGYWLTGHDDSLDKLYGMQLWDVTLLLANVIAAWLLVGEVLGRRRLAQLAAGAIAGLVPLETFLATSITPDALLAPLWTTALWLGARVIRRRALTVDTIALGAVTAAAVLTKATSYALVPGALLAMLLGWLAQPKEVRRARRRAAGAGVGALVLPIIGWVLTTKALNRPTANTVTLAPGTSPTSFNTRQFLSYVWQYYLPRLWFLQHYTPTAGYPAYDVWIKEGWADFGWLDVELPGWIYPVFGWFTAVVGAAGVVIVAARTRGAENLRLLAFFLLVLVALLIGLHVTDYESEIKGQGWLLQGRYLLPVLGLGALAVARVLCALPSRVRPAMTGALLGGLLLLQLFSLGWIAMVYYT